MRYWLFQVMSYFPELWPKLIKEGLAAQAYPQVGI